MPFSVSKRLDSVPTTQECAQLQLRQGYYLMERLKACEWQKAGCEIHTFLARSHDPSQLYHAKLEGSPCPLLCQKKRNISLGTWMSSDR